MVKPSTGLVFFLKKKRKKKKEKKEKGLRRPLLFF
jgi:hypothetical protein